MVVLIVFGIKTIVSQRLSSLIQIVFILSIVIFYATIFLSLTRIWGILFIIAVVTSPGKYINFGNILLVTVDHFISDYSYLCFTLKAYINDGSSFSMARRKEEDMVICYELNLNMNLH